MHPFPGPLSVLVMDGCSIHKNLALYFAAYQHGFQILITPPYSPWFNAIEESCTKITGSKEYQEKKRFGRRFVR